VKRENFETFWTSHHFGLVFYGCLLWHGSVFWRWAAGPFFLYFVDRSLRGVNIRPTRLVQAKWEPPNVLELGLANPVGALGIRETMKYKEGQYLKLNVPSISSFEWHPFTISSAPNAELLTVHIKCGKPNSWTGRLRKLLFEDLPLDRGEQVLRLKRTEDGVEAEGATHAPDGSVLIRVDGPHAAPCQHITEYDIALLTGAGIGLTPFSSALRSVIEHRWPAGQGPHILRFHWVVRLQELEAYTWFLKMLRHLHTLEAQAKAAGMQVMLDTNIHITGGATPAQVEASARSCGLPRSTMTAGRPDWKAIFKACAEAHRGSTIGVFHCGPFAKTLSPLCRENTTILTNSLHSVKEETRFCLHAEVF